MERALHSSYSYEDTGEDHRVWPNVTVRVSISPNDTSSIYELKKEIKKENSNILTAIDAVQLKVYAAGTSYPIVEGQDNLDNKSTPVDCICESIVSASHYFLRYINSKSTAT